MCNNPDYSPWPPDFLHSLSGLDALTANDRDPSLQRRLSGLTLPPGTAAALARLYYPLALYLHERLSRSEPPLVLGLNGAQGTGKSTAARVLKILLERLFNRGTCAFSIDDLYLSREARRHLADTVHPLLLTRGVPGTHDVDLGLELLVSLRRAGSQTLTVIPRFDKAHDQPLPEEARDVFTGRPDVILFEGWCVGAVPEPAPVLENPVNDLERLEDADGKWRRYVNRRLVDYQPLFALIDVLAMLKAPSFGKVHEWRAQQERELAGGLSGVELRNSRIMGHAELNRFLMHYERLTRWMLKEMPARAGFVFELDDRHAIQNVIVNIGKPA
jgi:D-glycerate 3-kinase